MPIHQKLASDQWQKLNLSQQLANIGSEFNRLDHWHQAGDKTSEDKALERLLELVDLTLNDKRWQARCKELVRLREIICDFAQRKNNYQISAKALTNYFLPFALIVRKR